MKESEAAQEGLEMLPSSDKNGLLIFHWDTDGICSAAIIIKHFGKDIDLRIPYIGNYYLTAEEIAEISEQRYDFIIVADMAIPEENTLQLKKESCAEIYIFDHHLQNIIEEVYHYNPISMGEPAENYPSNSWSLSKYLKREIDILSVLGAVGDNGIKLKNNREAFPKIEAFLENSNLSFDDLMIMVELIDSNYKVGNREMARNAVSFLKDNMSSPGAILDNKDWIKNLGDIEKEMAEQCNKPVKQIDGITIQEIDTKYNIISTLTRQLAWNSDSKVSIVVNRGYFDKDGQVYIRAGSPDVMLKLVIDLAQNNGYSAGGKKEVAGIVLPKKDIDDFIIDVINILKEII